MRIALVSMLGLSLLSAACGGLSGGPRKVVVNEDVCANVRFLRMKLGETSRVIVDNSKHSDNQNGITLVLADFPLLVKGEVPPNSTIGSPLSTIRLQAKPGEQTSVDVQATYTGTFTAQCNVTLRDKNGLRIVQKDLTFQLVAK
jgi:hypothetical protein